MRPQSAVLGRRHCPGAVPAGRSAAADAASSRNAGPPQAVASVPPLPPALEADLAAARRSWLDRCVSAPLVDATTNSRVHLCGVAHFAPQGGAAGLVELQELLERVRPTILAIEQPFDLAARAGLPFPEVIQEVANSGARLFAGPGAEPLPWEAAAGTAPTSQSAARSRAAARAEAERLAALLPGLAVPARLGRDMLDPFEVLGLYGGCEYVTRPGQLAEALSLFGWLPGLEYGMMAALAQELEVQVYSIDAPLRLQEKWVTQLVADFTLREEDLARRLSHDLARAQAGRGLPGGWDAAVAEAVRQIEAAAVADQLGLQALAERGAGGSGSGDPREPPLRTVTAFKASRAVAAATLPYEAAREAFSLQAGLQPLKFGLFARRARHLVLQIRDLCQRMSVRRVRVDADAVGGKPAAPPEGAQEGGGEAAEDGAPVSLVDVGGRPAQVVLAVMGRQYVPYIEEMWANERSALWHGEVLLALVVRLMALPDKDQLANFLRAKPEAISVPFLSWIADQEANAVGEQKRVLAGICEELVRFREQVEDERMEALYADTLTALTDGEADPGAAALVLAASPGQYATQLAERVTGSPMVTDGYDPVYDVLLKVVPPAALTPEGVRQGHEKAKELAVDLRARRKRSVQAMIGRAQLTPEQADRLMAGSNASRILDMLLQLPSAADRLACLPDCFTPPDAELLATVSAAGDDGRAAPAMSAPSPTSDSEDLVWCTPSQLLVELEARLQRLEGRGPRPPLEGGQPPAAMLAPPGAGAGSLTGEELLAELRALRDEVRRTWLDTLDTGSK
ncbi:hypothetical protein GPECTOR_50g628 [Gonium pectorale]|uniref:Uncharacterized protein n=1 Tax=Gonium pectorale TaxID=33097 RepID=A0A150G7L9_GONPE|nr:hypothetical protein GPECTOR_50g628 [Gonium pectorale]|eukprot:KXZ45834.1 hypothetical protein GPECTOR_50g628 [Gonium pectorale]